VRFPVASRIICWHKIAMSTLITGKKRKGRPRVDSDEVTARLQRPLLDALEAWAEAHGTTRAEAIRRLIQRGLVSHDSSPTTDENCPHE